MIRLDITNNGTGTFHHGNYNIMLTMPAQYGPGLDVVYTRVEGFDRRGGALALLRKVVDALEAEMNSPKI